MKRRIVWILNHHGTEDMVVAVIVLPICVWFAGDGFTGLASIGFGWMWWLVPPILFGYGILKWRILGPDARGSKAEK